MRRLQCALLATVAVIGFTSVAPAADLPTKAPVYKAPVATPLPSWTGFYLGLNAGYAWGKSDPTLIGSAGTALPVLFTETFGGPPSLNPRGFIGGGQAGYNWQTGHWVFGAEVDFSGLDAKADASKSPFFNGKGNQNAVSWSSRYDWLFTARLRGGYLVAPNWLLYVTGGLAVTHVSDSAVCTGRCTVTLPSGTIAMSESSTLTGGTVGGGIETMFGPNWTARLEYLYAKFKDTTPPVTSVSPPTVLTVPPLFSFNHDLNLVRFAINYKFSP
jgi:outer membrane immunogenic protein